MNAFVTKTTLKRWQNRVCRSCVPIEEVNAECGNMAELTCDWGTDDELKATPRHRYDRS